ncbi:hypothetical protein [Halarsenatibacter silvermanii]|uniref:DUF8052 domain-containing protein n=1 Tax=Halarsenatibacter silvermanii TaxID=321763 RepID=A0A1G9KJ25_9FIRM|nr:hypothetical protein [Halarsenatibacter silvermanii]SDL49403.1 hypothetical protein SAMN04488692_10525 [Halarsenatibacter silvermanii]
MESEKYFEMMLDMYYQYFDLYENEEVLGREFDLYAFLEVTNERFMGVKSIKIYQYNDFEHSLVEVNDEFSDELIDDSFFSECIDELIVPESGHHQSFITYIQIVGKPLTSEEISLVENYNYSTSFWLGIRGWCDIRLIVVETNNWQVYANQAGEEVKENYDPHMLADHFGYEI